MKFSTWLIIGLLTGLALIAGRHGLGVNQDAYYLPLVVKDLAPGPLYQNDLYLETLAKFVTGFYPLVVALARLIGLSASFLIVHIVSIWLFISALFLLSLTLFKTTGPGLLTSLFLLLPKFSLGGIYVGINHGYVYQSLLAFPLGLLALWLWLKQGYLLAFGLLGLTVNLHSLTGLSLLLVFSLDLVWQKRWRRLFLGLLLAAILAWPTLWLSWRREGLGQNTISLDQWLIFNRLRNSHHLFPFSWDFWTWIKGLWPLLPAYLVLKRPLKRLGLIVGTILIFSLIFTEIIPDKTMIRLQWFRLSMFGVVLGWLSLSRILLAWRLPLKPLLIGAILVLSFRGGHLNPAHVFSLSPSDRDWLAAQDWIRNNTPAGDRLYLLPFLPTFRPFSQRSHNLTWPEMTTAIVNDRVATVGLETLAQYGLDPGQTFASSLDVQNRLKARSLELDPETILGFARNEQSQYLVLPADFPWPEPALFRNGSYRLEPVK